jgi:hypothetical protein
VRFYSIGYILETIYPEFSDKISLNAGFKFLRLVEKGKKSENGYEVPVFLGYNFDNEKVSPFINYGVDFYSMITLVRLGLKIYGVKIVGQLEALNIIDMVRIGRIKIYTIGLGYEF